MQTLNLSGKSRVKLKIDGYGQSIARARNTADRSRTTCSCKMQRFQNLVFFSFLFLSSNATHSRCVDSRWQSLIFTQFPSASGYEQNKIKRKRIVLSVLKKGAFFVIRYIFEAGGIYEFCRSCWSNQVIRIWPYVLKLISWLCFIVSIYYIFIHNRIHCLKKCKRLEKEILKKNS